MDSGNRNRTRLKVVFLLGIIVYFATVMSFHTIPSVNNESSVMWFFGVSMRKGQRSYGNVSPTAVCHSVSSSGDGNTQHGNNSLIGHVF